MKLIDIARLFGLQQYIGDPTHISAFSVSCIDLIFSNAKHVCQAGTISNVISDHFPVFICKKKDREHRIFSKIEGRSYSNYDKTILQNLLSSLNWDFYFSETDPDILWAHLFGAITQHLSIMCPLKQIRVTNNPPPWITHYIFEAINDRNNLFTKAYKSGDYQDLVTARKSRNYVNKLINTSKSDFINETLDNNYSDPKKFWRIINSTIIKPTQSNSDISLQSENGTTVTGDQTCKHFNKYFASLGSSSEITPGNSPSDYNDLPGIYMKAALEMDISISEREVRDLIDEINIHKGSGFAYVPAFVLRDAFSVLVKHLTHLFNTSLTKGIFPASWAIASITPIPKSGNLLDVRNWRPISIIPLVGDILADEQFGFRPGRSTTQAIFKYTKSIIESINDKKVVGSLYLDFSRAFDSVNHEILISKLADMGICSQLVNWIQGYLAHRKIRTNVISQSPRKWLFLQESHKVL